MTMRIRHTAPLLAVLATFLALAGTAHGATLPAGFEDVEVVPNVKSGTSIAFAPDGSMFYNEGGDIRMRRPGVATPVNVGRVSGFILGLATDVQFAGNRYLFVNYVTNSNATTPGNARVARFSIGANGVAGPATVILGTVSGACPNPNTTDCMPNLNTSEHDIGSVVSDPRDGTLWITNGDNAAAAFTDPLSFNAQNPDSLQGKALHVDRDGRGLPGHPFCPTVADLTRNCTKVHAVGLRNAYRMNLGPMGLPVAGDVGWNSREELNVYRAGRNYGWPCYEGTLRTPSWNARSECAPLYALEGTPNGGQPPVHEYDQTVGESIIGGPTITNPAWPAEMRNEVLFGDYVAGWLKRARFNAAGDLIAVNNFATDMKRVVEMKFGPDGDLYYLLYSGATATGAIRKIHSTGSATANRAPQAKAAASVTAGRLPLRVRFSSGGSSDPDGDQLSYAWDFGDGSRSTEANPTHTYQVKRVVTATLTVSDGRGGSNSSSVRINAGDIPPRIRLTAPSRFRAGRRVTLSATATNPDGAALRARNYSWTVRLRHQTHDHPVSDPTGRQRISFTPLIDHDADSYYIVSLTVTEASGARSVRTVRIRPQTSRLRIRSIPAGAPVTYGGSVFASPMNRLSAIGYRTTVSVPASFTVGGRTYVFDRWSNGRARQHNLVIPARNLTLTARYRQPGQSARTRARTITALRFAPATVKVGQRARIRYTMRRSGRVRLTFMRTTKGYVLGDKCRATSVAPAGTERCTLQVRSGVMKTRARAGRNTIAFRGRVGGRRLKPGRYVVVARLLDSKGRAIGERRVSLRVKR
ncbi:MAG: Cytochrome c551/c552 [uncultured Solirubrobacteraceae bacterium]|uniref:Cytochrome c551/c552 n=1 Tax=uncultured Solirubrobacteraceae bacterium TaxID=1162706 RepID=A0A6J4SJJ7_9ACTN|nr:MAG: Cytochrome c551/c552 [uncultured Solirubrobacteraceae bacterium]